MLNYICNFLLYFFSLFISYLCKKQSWNYLVRNTLDFVKCNFDERYFKEQCVEVPFKFKVAVFLFGKDKKYGYKMINEAVKDAKAGKTGLHEIYKPGWNPNK